MRLGFCPTCNGPYRYRWIEGTTYELVCPMCGQQPDLPLVAKVAVLMKDLDWVSCVELVNRIPEARGDYVLEIGRLNVVLMFGLSSEAIEAIGELHKLMGVCLKVGSSLGYVIDGGALTLPVAKRVPKKGYRETHWLPTFLCKGTGGISVEEIDWRHEVRK